MTLVKRNPRVVSDPLHIGRPARTSPKPPSWQTASPSRSSPTFYPSTSDFAAEYNVSRGPSPTPAKLFNSLFDLQRSPTLLHKRSPSRELLALSSPNLVIAHRSTAGRFSFLLHSQLALLLLYITTLVRPPESLVALAALVPGMMAYPQLSSSFALVLQRSPAVVSLYIFCVSKLIMLLYWNYVVIHLGYATRVDFSAKSLPFA